jgi:hypothetical protein
MTPTQLRALILAQPDGSPIREAFDAADDGAVAAMLNAIPGANGARDMDFGEWQGWAVKSGTLAACREAVAAAEQSPQIKALCQQVLDIYAASLSILYFADVATFAGALAATKVITTTTRDALLAALVVPRSKPVEMWGRGATADDIAAARKVGG